MVNEQFAKWAMPPAGIFGGNPKGKIWFCGIEFGGSDYNPKLERFSCEDNNTLPFWDDMFKKGHNGAYVHWQYQQKQAKIACRILQSGETWESYIRDKLFAKNGDTFTMNLFPLGFDNTTSQWGSDQYKNTGLLTKTEYAAFCIQYRFPELKKLVDENEPAVLICTGTSYREFFLRAFLDNPVDIIENELLHPKDNNKAKTFSTHICGGKTLLVLCPFLGPGGLMSNQSLVDLADYVKQNWRYSKK